MSATTRMTWVVLVALALPAALAGQSPLTGPGVTIGVGFGAGSFKGTCEACGDQGTTGLDREVTIGTMIGPRLAVGAAVIGWIGSADAYTEHESALLGSLKGYPLKGRPLHLDLGAGMGRYRTVLDHPVGTSQRVSADGFAWSVGLGYDLLMTQDLVVVPQLTYRRIVTSPLTLDGTALGKSGFRVVSFGVAIRWRAIRFGVDPAR